jgi:hypothetical protein
MLRSNGDLLYVGKATSLKKRVCSYFQKRRHTSEHILEMLTQARDLDITVTPTSLEAALLEVDEIKRRSPPYNKAMRERTRDLVYTSRGFQEVVEVPSRCHCLGPLPRNIVSPLFHMVSLAHTGQEIGHECLDYWQLRIPPEKAPCLDCLKQGWKRFRRRYSYELSHPSRCLFLLGAKLWLDRRNDTENEDTGNQAEGRCNWSPEEVCHLLESRLMATIHWARRIRWYGLLSDSSITWKPRYCQDNNRILLVLKSGSVIERNTLSQSTTIPDPPGYQVPTVERLRRLDTTSIDRLTVLTTELKRLASDNRMLQVKLSPKSTLDSKRLSTLLRWV